MATIQHRILLASLAPAPVSLTSLLSFPPDAGSVANDPVWKQKENPSAMRLSQPDNFNYNYASAA